MRRKAINTIDRLWIIVAIALFFELAITTACSRQGAGTQKTSPSADSPMRLNLEEMGTTKDTSKLQRFLLQLFEYRDLGRGYRPGTNETEKTVYLWPEESLKVTEIAKVSEAIRMTAAKPLLHTGEDAGLSQAAPYPMALVLFLGSPKSKAPVIGMDRQGNLVNANGIELIFHMDVTLQHLAAERELGKNQLLIEIPKDGEYSIDLKPVGRSDLKAVIQRHLKEKSLGSLARVFIADDVSWSSLAEVGEAAYSSGVREFSVAKLVP